MSFDTETRVALFDGFGELPATLDGRPHSARVRYLRHDGDPVGYYRVSLLELREKIPRSGTEPRLTALLISVGDPDAPPAVRDRAFAIIHPDALPADDQPSPDLVRRFGVISAKSEELNSRHAAELVDYLADSFGYPDRVYSAAVASPTERSSAAA